MAQSWDKLNMKKVFLTLIAFNVVLSIYMGQRNELSITEALFFGLLSAVPFAIIEWFILLFILAIWESLIKPIFPWFFK